MDVTQDDLERLAAEVGRQLLRHGWMLATAESCTGGWAAQAITAVAGSSAWFERGFVTYANAAKIDMLGVGVATLEAHGAVSVATVAEMAAGALRYSRAQAAYAISGIAGPGGGSPDKPVGTVWFGFALPGEAVETVCRHFPGDRRRVRMAAVDYAFRHLLDRLSAVP
jgi:nicotinamide-nucleotide amidase